MHPGIVHSIIMPPFHIPVTVTVTVGRPPSRGIFGTQTEPGELRARASLALVCTLALHWHWQ